jgi:hypothetical protein
MPKSARNQAKIKNRIARRITGEIISFLSATINIERRAQILIKHFTSLRGKNAEL